MAGKPKEYKVHWIQVEMELQKSPNKGLMLSELAERLKVDRNHVELTQAIELLQRQGKVGIIVGRGE